MSPATRVPDFMEPLIGYRTWCLDHMKERLESAYDTVWIPYKAVTAQCHCDKAAAFVAPLSTCSSCPSPKPITVPVEYQMFSSLPWYYPCGLYAWRSLDYLCRHMNEYGPVTSAALTQREPILFGRVRLWGVVYPHERGYRAQYAYPDEILLGVNTDAEQIAKRYGISYVFNQEVDRAYRDFAASRVRGAAQFANPFPRIVPVPTSGAVPGCACPACEQAREDERRAGASGGQVTARVALAGSVRFVSWFATSGHGWRLKG